MGCFCNCSHCCISEDSFCCRTSNVDGEWCICCSCRYVQVMPYTCYKCISSCFCLDCRCSYPYEPKGDTPCICNLLGLNICLDGGFNIGCCKTLGALKEQSNQSATSQILSQMKSKKDVIIAEVEVSKKPLTVDVSGKAEFGDLNVCFAFCCVISSLFCKMPDVFGSSSVCSCLCVKCEQHNCKPAVERNDVFKGEICLCQTATCICMAPRTCCSWVGQNFCCDNRCSFPCDGKGDIPCTVNCCFINFCHNWGCLCGQTYFHPIKDLIATKGGEQIAHASPVMAKAV